MSSNKSHIENVLSILEEEMIIDAKDLESIADFSEVHLDNLDRCDMVISLEDIYDIDIPDYIYKRWNTVKDVMDYLNAVHPTI